MDPEATKQTAEVSFPWFSMIGAFCLATFGGIVHYLQGLISSKRTWSLLSFIVESLTSGFVGILAFFLCEYVGLSHYPTAFIVAMTGHLGAKAIQKFQLVWVESLRSMLTALLPGGK